MKVNFYDMQMCNLETKWIKNITKTNWSNSQAAVQFCSDTCYLIFTSIFKQIGRQMRDFVTALLLLKEVQKAGCIVFEEVKKTF